MQLKEIAQLAVGATGFADLILVYRMTAERYKELVTIAPIKPLTKTNIDLIIPANVTTGAATATLNSNKVLGDAAALAVWTNDLIGRYIRFDANQKWFEILAFEGTNLTISSPWVDDTVTAGGYRIVARYARLDKNIRRLSVVRNINLGIEVMRMSLEDLNRRAPWRTTDGGGPLVYAEVGDDTEGERILEFYPFSKTASFLQYDAQLNPRELEPNDEIPDYVDSYSLIEGVKLSILARMSLDAYTRGDAQLGANLGNEAARQRTIWKQAMNYFVAHSEVVADATAQVESYGRASQFPNEIVDAYGQVVSSWTPLT